MLGTEHAQSWSVARSTTFSAPPLSARSFVQLLAASTIHSVRSLPGSLPQSCTKVKPRLWNLSISLRVWRLDVSGSDGVNRSCQRDWLCNLGAEVHPSPIAASVRKASFALSLIRAIARLHSSRVG